MVQKVSDPKGEPTIKVDVLSNSRLNTHVYTHRLVMAFTMVREASYFAVDNSYYNHS